MKLSALIFLASIGVAGLSSAGAQELPAAYTEEQAAAGAEAFAQSCGGCHGADMIGIFHTYPTAKTYWDFITVSMPFDQPGTLSPRRYLSIIAWLMRENGFPAGDTALTDSTAVLNSIIPGDAPGAEPVAQ
jgi:mono/diheme cytochrome c family protein